MKVLRKLIRQILEEETTPSHKAVSELKMALDSEKAYEILDKYAHGTWTEGGCAILAFALSEIYNASVVVIFNRNKGITEHFMVKLNDGAYLDYDGLHKDPVGDFRHNEMIPYNHELVLMPFKESLPHRGIVVNKKASKELARFLNPKMLSIPQNPIKYLKQVAISRFPFLKKYEKIEKKSGSLNYVSFKKEKYLGEMKLPEKKGVLQLSNVLISSELKISYRKLNNLQFINFLFDNKVSPFISPEDDSDNLTQHIFHKAKFITNESMRYQREFVLEHDEFLTKKDVDSVINEISKKSFEFENYIERFWDDNPFFE